MLLEILKNYMYFSLNTIFLNKTTGISRDDRQEIALDYAAELRRRVLICTYMYSAVPLKLRPHRCGDHVFETGHRSGIGEDRHGYATQVCWDGPRVSAKLIPTAYEGDYQEEQRAHP